MIWSAPLTPCRQATVASRKTERQAGKQAEGRRQVCIQAGIQAGRQM